MRQTKTITEFKMLLYLFKLTLECNGANKLNLESELIKNYELQEIYIEFLQLQLNYEYGNIEEDYFIEKSKEYLELLKED